MFPERNPPAGQGVQRALRYGSGKSNFQGWKIPNRLVPEPVSDGSQEVALAAVLSGQRDRGKTTPRFSRERSLPVIGSSRQNKLGKPSLSPRVTPPLHSPALPIRSNTVIGGPEFTTKERLGDSLQPHTVSLADDWLRQAPHADRKVIEKVLRMQEKKHQLDHVLKKSLLPDTRKNVENWLETATDSERQVALKFFSSLAGAKLMGTTAQEQKGRLQHVIKTLESNKGQASTPAMRRSLDSSMKTKESKLKYVQLLDPETRANRWMHTTWHHLPEYKNDDPVTNWSSHYIRPHAPTPRHFVIHPDWG